MLKRKLFIGLALALVLAMSAPYAFAGSTDFNVVVPRLGGGANSDVTTKNTDVQQWAVNNIQVGGGKTVNFQPQKGSGTAIGTNTSGTTGSVINSPFSPAQAVGTLIYLKITTLWYELVSVQVSGHFNSN